MISPELKSSLPSTEDLPCSDDTPVDNEDQNLLPNLLLFVLNSIWSQRLDWYFGVDMAVYHTTGISPKVPVVPDGFLSLGVERQKGGKSRRSYAVWEEREIVPILALEMVSHQPGGEYDEKMAIYAGLGVLYYIIYNPEFWRRDRHQPFEVYQLSDGEYRQQIGEPYWMPEVGLGMGRSLQTIGGIEREILAWYDEGGNVYPLPEVAMRQMREQLRIEREHAETERQRAERLAQYLRSQGIDPDNLPEF
ncbi:MAG TPA: Uma2 family endonuclease [Oscillatoriales cyanobacterium M59_W2019_021]|nr:Uma2 family endonuclease [Oscillatoriales cyanobacterium M4454_W2019_049]HIK51603.1 Uma2 family endonuclease [Oscillatoriales cyanobacterium M59_W2019_021]